jgi:tripartite-type tricarboxylate transporter receptor subunit TctC
MSRRANLVRLAALAASPAAIAWPGWAGAQSGFPSRPLRIVVPTPPGGNLDAVSRAIGERLTALVGQPVVVENRTGASSTVGTRHVAQSPADGYTLLTMANTFLSTPAVMANAGYDAETDFTGVSMLVRLPNVIVVPVGSPFQTLRELIEGARAKPGEVTFATAGAGSVGHISAERFARDLGLKLVHVPYKGNGPALIDMVGGRVAMMFDQVSTSAPHVRSGRLRALAVTSAARSPVLPDVPTMAEAGVRDFEDYTFNGFAVAAATPRDVVAQLHAAVTRALQDPELRARFTGQGMEVVPSPTPDAFNRFMKDEVARYRQLARDANIRVE